MTPKNRKISLEEFFEFIKNHRDFREDTYSDLFNNVPRPRKGFLQVLDWIIEPLPKKERVEVKGDSILIRMNLHYDKALDSFYIQGNTDFSEYLNLRLPKDNWKFAAKQIARDNEVYFNTHIRGSYSVEYISPDLKCLQKGILKIKTAQETLLSIIKKEQERIYDLRMPEKA